MSLTVGINITSGPEPAILDWYWESFKIRHSEIASEVMFGPYIMLV